MQMKIQKDNKKYYSMNNNRPVLMNDEIVPQEMRFLIFAEQKFSSIATNVVQRNRITISCIFK